MLFFTQTDLKTMEFDLETKKQIIAQAQSHPDNLKDEKEKEKLEALVSKYEKDKVNYQIKKEIVQDEGKIDIVLSWAGIISGMSERNRYNYELQFSLRAIHKYLPWINKIYILINSDTKPPYWLKENYPDSKIVIVDRCTLIANPAHCPTYNTFAIYSVVHKIPGLANKFILMDDDFFFNRPVGPEYMFTPMGLPIVYQDYQKSKTYGNKDPLLPEIRSKGYPLWKYAPWTHIPMPMRRDYIIKFDENYPGYLELVQSHYEKRYRTLTEEVSMTYYLFFKNKGWIKTPGRQKAMFFQTPKFHKNDITQEFENYYNIIVNRKKITFNVNDSFSKQKGVYKKQRKVLWDFYMKLYPETPDYELPNPNHKKYS
ncbi:hypothetical protein M0812_22867 [Anaeramoeba flamelloides]|uniref:Stealth protein CR2 conserved region 2 domain-containing protein n=1 Tax=Anaeramoeba flamelloides TaxID=1746091 RepID=A0AAV7YJB7_9EUKA|nr:hypothetical protein M0812_22867 [Anaeramoeba flamelloides]